MLQIKEIDANVIEKGLTKLFSDYTNVQKKVCGPIKHDLLLAFKPPFYELKDSNSLIFNWYPYERSLSDLKEYYRKYYNLKTLKQNDSTLKTLLEAFKTEVSYYTVSFKSQAPYNIIITK